MATPAQRKDTRQREEAYLRVWKARKLAALEKSRINEFRALRFGQS